MNGHAGSRAEGRRERDVPSPGARTDLKACLAACVDAADSSLDVAQELSKRLLSILDNHNRRVGRVRLPASNPEDEQLRELQQQFASRLDALKAELHVVGTRFGEELEGSFAALRADAAFVTVALFGRTKAGKSTTMEALTHGDGSTRGTGAQHTTKEVRAYYWPPEQRTLRVVDTPGIEGFLGEALSKMAQEFIERADLVFFLFSDDKAGAEELDRFGRIRTFGKSVTVVLNVKEADLSMVTEMPEYVFGKIDGHQRRIRRYLREHFDLDDPEVLPVHALAAWRSTKETSEKERARLRECSRIESIEQRLESFARYEARAARIRSPRDNLYSHVVTAKNQLRPYAGMFRALYDAAVEHQRKLRAGVHAVISDEQRRCRDLSVVFDEAEAELDELVDTLIASGKKGAPLNRAWEDFLGKHGLDQVERAFKKTVVARLQKEIAAQIADSGFDAAHEVRGGDVANLFSHAHEQRKHDKSKLYARAGVRAAGSVGVGALAAWAVANFWNPTGWLAGIAAVGVVAGAGYAGERGARAATDAWKETDRKSLARERDKIVAALGRQLSRYSDGVVRACEAWLTELPKALDRQFQGGLGYVESGAQSIWQATVRTLHELDDAAADLDREWLEHCLRLVEQETGVRIPIRNAVYVDRCGAKLLVADLPKELASKSAWYDLLESVVGAPVILVDDGLPLSRKVAAALAPARISPESVRRVDKDRRRQNRSGPKRPRKDDLRRRIKVEVVLLNSDEAKAAIGPGGANARAAQRLLKLASLKIVGPRDQRKRK